MNQTINSALDYRIALQRILAERQARRPTYSLRAFARDLGVSATAMSDVLALKRHLSKKNMDAVATALAMSPKSKANMLCSAGYTKPNADFDNRLNISEEEYHFISNWYFFAILNLAKLPGAKDDPAWLSERLGISEIQARDAIELLERRGYLERRRGKLRRTVVAISSTTDVPSTAIRTHNSQMLDKAKASIWEVPVTERDVSSVTLALDKKKLKEAKTLIAGFKRQLAALVETSKPDDVYNLSVQLFPLTKRSGAKHASS